MKIPRTPLENRYARSERMIGRDVGGEFILVPLVGRGADLDSVFNLNGVATFIWQQLDGKNTGRDVVRALVAEFQVDEGQAQEDYLALISQLVEINAVHAA
jgi:Coenzyme PQQ synthesis protein D (PqqD)